MYYISQTPDIYNFVSQNPPILGQKPEPIPRRWKIPNAFPAHTPPLISRKYPYRGLLITIVQHLIIHPNFIPSQLPQMEFQIRLVNLKNHFPNTGVGHLILSQLRLVDCIQSTGGLIVTKLSNGCGNEGKPDPGLQPHTKRPSHQPRIEKSMYASKNRKQYIRGCILLVLCLKVFWGPNRR
jgi:hypothetical protein